MSSFKKTNSKAFVKTGTVVTPDTLYWKQLGVPVLVKEFGAIDYIDFSPVEPHYFAVTCSVRVQVYNPITKLVAKNLSRFRESAYGGCFRKDGKLLCAGGEETNVKLFDVSSKRLLRLFKGHDAPVHRTCFTTDLTHIASFSDDKTIKLWDIPNETAVTTFTGHTDYVRAGCVSPVSHNITLSGGYDNTVMMWDDRTSERAVLNVCHGSPVESVLFLPSGGVFLTAGGNDIKVWDCLASGRPLAHITQHHKTVTCLRLASHGRRLLSSSLDRHVKIYDVTSYTVVHTLDFPSPVLSLAVSSNDETLVAGMVDGLISIHRREEEVKPTKTERKLTSYKYASNIHPTSVDTVVAEKRKEQQSKYDACLRKFQYSKALDGVLLPYVTSKNPDVTVSVFQELLRRKGLNGALAGRDDKSLMKILRFLIRYIGDYRFTRVLIDVTNIFLDVYEDMLNNFSPEVNKLIIRLSKRLEEEEELSLSLANLQGAIHLLLAGASVTDKVDNEDSYKVQMENLKPSINAQQNFTINVN